MNVPQTRYARSSDGAYIAYQVFGGGEVDLLWISPWFSHLELLWEYPPVMRFHAAMASFARVILLDQRGIGLSDRTGALPDLETRMDDIRAVLDAVGSQRTVLWGAGLDGGALCTMYAATYPERVSALALWNASAKGTASSDYPHGPTPEQNAAFSELIAEGWGLEERTAELMIAGGAPSIADDPGSVRWAAKVCRHMGSPGDVLAFERMYGQIDFRAVCPSIQVPTVAIFTDDPSSPDLNAACEDLVTRIPGAVKIIVPAGDFPPWPTNTDAAVAALRSFIAATRDEEASFDRVLATVLFTDIVDSTATIARLGDAKWRYLVERHHATVRSLLARYRGTEVDTAGDGFFATFDGPARAARCATAIVGALAAVGITVRAGLHTGEVETIAGKVGGMAVVIGARVGALAGPAEVLASSTVKDLTVGSGLVFEDAGERELKGVPDRWHLYRVVIAPAG